MVNGKQEELFLMKIIRIPIKVFQTGDEVLTPDGKGVVIHDEMEDADIQGSCTQGSFYGQTQEELLKVIEDLRYHTGVHVRLLGPETEDHRPGDEEVYGRELL
jgi:hypothetical protein